MNGKIKTKFAALFAVALMITVCVVPVVGNEDVQAADVSSTIPEGISDIEIQLFTEDSKDFSDLIYCANGKGLPEGVDPVEWKEVAPTTGVYINVNKNSEYFGKFLRFGQTGLSNEEIIKLGNDNTWLPLIQVSYMYSDANLGISIDVVKDDAPKTSVSGSTSLNKAGVEFDVAECVTSIKFIKPGAPVDTETAKEYLNFEADLAGASGEYEVKVKTGNAVIASEKFSFESEKDLLSIKGTVTDAGTTQIKGAKVAYKIDNTAGTAVTDANGGYEIKFKKGSVVEITGITYGNGEYTFNGGYVFGTLTTSVTNGVADFKANELTGTITIAPAYSGMKASITLGWYYQYTTTSTVNSTPTTTYNISTNAPQGIKAGKVSILENVESSIKYTYISPAVDLSATTVASGYDWELINTGAPTVTGFTFKEVKLPATSTTSDLDAQIAVNTDCVQPVLSSSTFTANEDVKTLKVLSKNGQPSAGATVTLGWYYQYTTTSTVNSTTTTTYNISAYAPQGAVAGKVTVLTKSLADGTVYFSYLSPVWTGTTYTNSVDKLMLTNVSNNGYTFNTIVLPQTTTDETKELNDFTGISLSGDSIINAKEYTYNITGTVKVPGVKANDDNKYPELNIAYTNGIGSSVKVDVATPDSNNDPVYSYSFYAVQGKSCVITPTLTGYEFTPKTYTTPSVSVASPTSSDGFAVPDFVGKSTAEVTKFVDTTVLTPALTVSGSALAPGSDEKAVVVDLTYDVNGKQYTTPVKVVSTGSGNSIAYSATYNVAGVAGTYVELVSATAVGKQIAFVNGNWTATSTQIKTFYLFDGEEKIPVANLTLDLYYGTTSIGSITSGLDGFATLEVNSTYNTAGSYNGILNGKYKMTFELGIGAYEGYVIGDVSEIIGKNFVPINVKYIAAYNNSEDFVDATQIAGQATPITGSGVISYPAELGSTVVLKAPSIDGFEFVAWMIGGVVVSEEANFTLDVDGPYNVDALYSAVHYEEPAEGLSMNVLVIGIVILILGILAVAYGIISKKQ